RVIGVNVACTALSRCAVAGVPIHDSNLLGHLTAPRHDHGEINSSRASVRDEAAAGPDTTHTATRTRLALRQACGMVRKPPVECVILPALGVGRAPCLKGKACGLVGRRAP